jgi:glycosyltransferase involved in cell wall biosynthesis
LSDSTTRTVVVAHSGSGLYGADRMTLETVTGLVQQGLRVILAVPEDGPLLAEAERVGAQAIVLETPVLRGSMRRPLELAGVLGDSGPAARRISDLLRRERPVAVYVSTVTIPLWISRARLVRIPVVVHVHESEAGTSRIVRAALAHPIGHASRVVINSASTRDALLHVAPGLEGRSVTVPNGVAGPPAVVPPRERIDGPFRLAYVGRLSPTKGVDVAVEAVAALVAGGVDTVLDVVGSPMPGYDWFVAALHARVDELGLTSRVRFTGFQRDVWPVLAAADMALVPARAEESFGNTAAEALLSARPVAVSAVGGLRDTIAGFDSVVAVRPSDVAGLADAIRAVRHDWPTYRRAALDTAAVAAERYRTDRYRDAVVQQVLLAAGEPVGSVSRAPEPQRG